MFQIGVHYDITIGTEEEWSSSGGKVLDWDKPLLKFEDRDGKITILNTSSPSFYKAQPRPSPEEVEAAEMAFLAGEE